MGHQMLDALKAAGLLEQKKTEPQNTRNGASPKVVRPTNVTIVKADWLPSRTGHVNQVRPQQSNAPHSGGMVSDRRPAPQAEPSSKVPAESKKSNTFQKTVPTAAAKPSSNLTQTGPFHPHPLFVDDEADRFGLPHLSSSGIERQLTNDPSNATDLIIGLDFGTSATKVVIRDSLAATGVFPVHLNGARQGIDGYLLPSRVYRTGAVYSLTEGDERIADLKLRLLACKASIPVTEFNDCCAFLALVIRRSRGWFFTEHHDIYGKHELKWRLNLGLAARSYQNEKTVNLFRRLAWAAANVAADADADKITVAVVDSYRRRSLDVFSGNSDNSDNAVEFEVSDVDAVPEVSAQLQGFMESARWDWKSRPVMMLVDVGAGTVDSAVFHVGVSSSGPGVLTFYSSRVESNGAMNLHRQRVGWLQSMLPEGPEHDEARKYLAAIERPTDRLRPIPRAATEYLPSYTVEVLGQDIDQDFQTNHYRAQVAGSINEAKVGKGLGSQQLQHVPLLLCGGGSRMPIYAGIAEEINQTQAWGSGRHVSVELIRLPLPQDLRDVGWHADDFDRLSVAYGLSLAGNGDTTLGKIVRAIEVPDMQKYSPPEREDRFISKDQM